MLKIKILTEKKKKKQDRCAARAKREFDVYPSYNAASAIARCRRGEIWKKGKKSEGVNEEQKAAPLNKIQQHNLNILLQSEYSNKTRHASNSIADNFVEDMINQEFERTGDMDIYERGGPNETAVMQELVQNVAPLSRNKITKAITGASFGKIFKLNNDHILKIFLGGVDVESDMKWFNKCYKQLHSGKAKRTTLPVYDFEWGSDAPMLPSFPNYKIGYVEMAEVEPLDTFLERTGRGEGDTIVSQAKALFKQAYYVEGKRDLKSIQEYVFQFAPEKEQLQPLTQNEVSRMIEAFYDMIKMGFNLSDVAPRNMGVLKQSNPSDPTIIIFDR